MQNSRRKMTAVMDVCEESVAVVVVGLSISYLLQHKPLSRKNDQVNWYKDPIRQYTDDYHNINTRQPRNTCRQP
jgi:hypothetical protein